MRTLGMVVLLVGLFYFACLGVDLLPWNRDEKKEE